MAQLIMNTNNFRAFCGVSLLLALTTSCNFSGVQQETDESFRTGDTLNVKTSELTELDSLDAQPANKDTIRLDNGIYFAYRKKGNGKQLKKDDVVFIDYRSKLVSGKVFDTNEKMGKPVPFMVGWGMQTTGWDLVFPYLHEGDEVEVFLPAQFARGEKGIPNLVPPHADNFISLRVVGIQQPDYSNQGVLVWVINRGQDQPKVKEGDELLIDYFAYARSKPRYDNSFKNGVPYSFKVGGNNLPGLNIGMKYGQLSDKLWIRIPAALAFGSKGNADLVKPNEDVFFDIRILKIMDEKEKEKSSKD
jgi:FKBP-type peptidyl-prolyl cis-trans isomerase